MHPCTAVVTIYTVLPFLHWTASRYLSLSKASVQNCVFRLLNATKSESREWLADKKRRQVECISVGLPLCIFSIIYIFIVGCWVFLPLRVVMLPNSLTCCSNTRSLLWLLLTIYIYYTLSQNKSDTFLMWREWDWEGAPWTAAAGHASVSLYLYLSLFGQCCV